MFLNVHQWKPSQPLMSDPRSFITDMLCWHLCRCFLMCRFRCSLCDLNEIKPSFVWLKVLVCCHFLWPFLQIHSEEVVWSVWWLRLRLWWWPDLQKVSRQTVEVQMIYTQSLKVSHTFWLDMDAHASDCSVCLFFSFRPLSLFNTRRNKTTGRTGLADIDPMAIDQAVSEVRR